MKRTIKLTFAICALATFGGSAFAQQHIRIAGSTAFRPAAMAGIMDILDDGSVNGTSHYIFSYTNNSNPWGSNAAIFSGTLKDNVNAGISGHPAVIIKTFWTGSLAGVVDLVAKNTIVSWINDSVLSGATTGGTAIATPYTTESPGSAPDVAMSDADKNSVAKSLAGATITSPVAGTTSVTVLQGKITTNSGNNAAVDAGTVSPTSGVGIIPFVWAASGTALPFSNMTELIAKTLVSNGYCTVSNLNGVSGNQNNYCFLVGRNEDSGTRITTFGEAQNGFGPPAQQWQVNSAANIQLFPVTPLNTEGSIVWNTAGHSGYASGGNVATALSTATAPYTFGDTADAAGTLPAHYSGNAYLVGYLSAIDSIGTGTVSSPGKITNGSILSYNGVVYDPTQVANGRYTFWGVEHEYYLKSNTGGATLVGQAADALADIMFTADAETAADGSHPTFNSTDTSIAGITWARMKYTRGFAGDVLTPTQ